MAFRVLVVDDSAFYRRRVSQILDQDPELEVVGDARNGQDAVEKVQALKPDVVTMDIEMPIMDGITAVKHIMRQTPVPIMMFSSLTHEGATATLDSLEAGALDFLPKNFEDIAVDRKEAVELLQARVRALGGRRASVKRFTETVRVGTRQPETPKASVFLKASNSAVAPAAASVSARPSSSKRYQVLAIGTSTGGPVALQRILTQLPVDFSYPILLVQHMPGTFTKAFAERLNAVCRISVKEAEHGDLLRPGYAYLAPGGKQMTLSRSGTNIKVAVSEADAHSGVHYKPSVDLTFESLAQVLGGEVLALILTGMGADGREGCRSLKNQGAKIWAQDEASSVVYGMPQAIVNANIADESLSLEDVASSIMSEMMGLN